MAISLDELDEAAAYLTALREEHGLDGMIRGMGFEEPDELLGHIAVESEIISEERTAGAAMLAYFLMGLWIGRMDARLEEE